MPEQMDPATKALCYFYRNPPAGSGVQPVPFDTIADMLGFSKSAVWEAAKTFRNRKAKRGRKVGWRKTTQAEDKIILQTFHKSRPPGHGVTARDIASNLPRGVAGKVCRRTLRRRLAEKGFTPQRKLDKHDLGTALRKKRLDFCRGHLWRSGAAWQEHVQACGDLKDYTWFPRQLKPRFSRINAPWTYMSQSEKHKPAFLRPKKPFTRKDYKKSKKGKVFGLTTSHGAKFLAHVPVPFTSRAFAALLRRRLGPFLQRAFPGRERFRILLDGEPLLHAPEAAEAMAELGIQVLPNWPGYSPDLNPQENVWPWIEKHVRKAERKGDTFGVFRRRLSRAAAAYPQADRLVPSMAKRMRECVERKGAMIGK